MFVDESQTDEANNSKRNASYIDLTRSDNETQPPSKRQRLETPQTEQNAPVVVKTEIELTAEQKKQVAAINKEFGPKLAEVQKAVNGVISKEQRQARNAANKKAKADGVKGKARNAAIQAALNLTDDQKAKMKELTKKRQDVQKAARAKFVEILTAEQKAKLPKKKKGKKKKKKKDA